MVRPRFFRDFNWANRLLMGLALLMGGFMVGKGLLYRGWQRQYWSTDVCSAPDDVVALQEGGFPGPSEYVPLYGDLVRSEADSLYGGGVNFAYEPGGFDARENAFRLAPKQLEVAWLSMRDNTFYRGNFALPTARIDSLFAAYKGRTDTTGWRFNRQPRDYDAVPPATESGLVLSVRLGRGGQVRLDVLEGRYAQYARPTPLAYFQARAYQPAWPPPARAPYHAISPAAYRDSLISQLDSTHRALLHLPPKPKKAR